MPQEDHGPISRASVCSQVNSRAVTATIRRGTAWRTVSRGKAIVRATTPTTSVRCVRAEAACVVTYLHLRTNGSANEA